VNNIKIMTFGNNSEKLNTSKFGLDGNKTPNFNKNVDESSAGDGRFTPSETIDETDEKS
jgi:hypothetical protein